MDRRHDFGQQDPDRRPRGPLPRRHEDQDEDGACAAFHQEVARQGAVGPSGLEQPPIQREQHEESGRREDGGDADPAALSQQFGDPVAGGEDQSGPGHDGQRALTVDPPGPAPDEMLRTAVGPHRDPPDHGHHDGRARHREDQEEPGQLVERPVGVRREDPGHGHGDDDVGPVGDNPGGGQRARLEQTRSQGFDARAGFGIERELPAEGESAAARRQGNGGRNPLDQYLDRARASGRPRCRRRPCPRSRSRSRSHEHGYDVVRVDRGAQGSTGASRPVEPAS